MTVRNGSVTLRGRAFIVAHCVQCVLLLALTALLNVVRGTLLSLLVIFEPLVTLVLSASAALGIVTAIVFETSVVGESFPFIFMVAFSTSSAMLLMAYRAARRLLAP